MSGTILILKIGIMAKVNAPRFLLCYYLSYYLGLGLENCVLCNIRLDTGNISGIWAH